ncbi:MAG: D-alanyl-D-alanine-carboxypeptidase/endopeptidase AmpH [Alphaproteobacteria bacterium]|nr:D-alanyl-D-alanine-carboxypeptidase/endopeptidase AmpH [Alphaproteobacteria bacterium]
MRPWLCAAFLLLFSSALSAEPMPPRLAARLDAIHAASKAHAMVAVVVDGDRTYVAAKNANGQSLIRINSLTKVMTGELLANLIAEGRIRLDAPLQRYAPPGRIVPRTKGRAITLRDLTAHASGLPRDMPPGLSKSARWIWLARQKLRQPGHVAEYSNAAYMFLGDALSAAANESYEALLERHITTPLALADTTLNPTPTQCARLLPTTHPCAPTHAIDAMGGLYSTADDMALWMRGQVNATPGTPRATAQNAIVNRSALTRVANLDMAGRMDAVAMGWLRMRLSGTQVLQKTGGGGGFMNYVILSPAGRKGLFITVNRVDIEMLRQLTTQANALMSEELPPYH